MKLDFSKKRKIVQILLWLLTITWFIVCLYLSWQTGEETSELSQQIARFLLDLLRLFGLEVDSPQVFHARLRLFAHFGVFFVTGFLTSGALYVSLPRGKWKIAFWVTVVSCALIAVLVEVAKLGIPGRHLTWSEAGLNVLGTICGIIAVRSFNHLFIFCKRRNCKSYT